MAKIKKIQESGETIYPATIFQAIKNPENGQTLEKSFESEHKKLTAGFAYEILGDGQATSEKFSFRPTGGPNRNVRDGSARIEVLKGNSVVWNQLIKKMTNMSSNGVTLTWQDDLSVRVTGTPTGVVLLSFGNLTSLTENEKIFVCGCPQGGSTSTFAITDQGQQTEIGNGAIWERKSYHSTVTFVPIIRIGADYVGQQIDLVFRPLIISLTKMFGAGNEPTTVEQFYELLPEGVDINAYNEGEIVDANYKAIKTTGFNQWDEQWEVGGVDGATGQEVFNSSAIRSKGYVRVIAGAKYNIKCPSQVILCAYDEDYNYIGYLLWGGSTTTFTIPVNAKYIRFGTYGTQYGPTYKNDICINIAWDEYSALNGTYKPYKPFERDLSWVANYFPNGMRSAGNVADEIRFNSTTQQWEAVQNVGVRAYQSGDEADTAVTTDGTNTNYALATPIVTPITEDVNLAYDVADYGTEQLIVPEGAQSAPLSAEVVYEPNVLASIKQVAAMLTRLDALETAVATMQASAVATTNEE